MHWKTRSAASGRKDGTPSPIARGKKEPLAEKLDQKKLTQIRKMLVFHLDTAAARKAIKDPETVAYLVECLKSENTKVGFEAAGVLGYFVEKKKTRDAALKGLLDALGNGNARVREDAALPLLTASKKGADISAAFPQLLEFLGDESATVRGRVFEALEDAAGKGGRRALEKMTFWINELLGSGKFAAEVEKNSEWYVNTVKKTNLIMRTVRTKMEEAA